MNTIIYGASDDLIVFGDRFEAAKETADEREHAEARA
jgi:hypothetical protein